MKKIILFCLCLLFCLIVACQSTPPNAVESQIPAKVITSTEPPIPTSAPTIAPTPTPQGQIFRDDFNGKLLPGWTWVNENTKNWNITGVGWLRIIGEDLGLIGNSFQNNLLLRDIPLEGNFEILTHVKAHTNSNFQQAALFLFEDEGNYFSINRGHCTLCPPRGSGIYSDYKLKDKNYFFNGRSIKIDDVYLKISVNRIKKTIIVYYATEPEKWVQLRKIPIVFNFTKAGLGVSNSDNGSFNDDLVAEFDFFEIRELK